MTTDSEAPRAAWSRRAFLGAGLAGVVAVYAGTRMLPSAMAATSTGAKAATSAFAVTNLVANPSFEVGAVGRSAVSWTIG